MNLYSINLPILPHEPALRIIGPSYACRLETRPIDGPVEKIQTNSFLENIPCRGSIVPRVPSPIVPLVLDVISSITMDSFHGIRQDGQAFFDLFFRHD
jgi:hypothetical protein